MHMGNRAEHTQAQKFMVIIDSITKWSYVNSIIRAKSSREGLSSNKCMYKHIKIR